MRITLELPEDIAQGLGSRWKDLPRAALESLALEAYRSHALTAAQLRRLLGFETRMQVDDFLKEHEVYDFAVEDLKQDCETLRQVRARELSIESAPVRSSWRKKCYPVDRPSSADHSPVVGFRLARQLLWDWSGSPSDSRVRKPVVQGALAQHLNDLQPSNSILRRSNCMRDLLVDTQAGPVDPLRGRLSNLPQ